MRTTAPGRYEDTDLRDARRPAGAPELEVSEVTVPSFDGAPVPLAIVHRRGLVLDGNNPTLLIGYGAYGFRWKRSTTCRAWPGSNAAAWSRWPTCAAAAPTAKPGTRRLQDHQVQHLEGRRRLRALPDERRYASPKTLGISGPERGWHLRRPRRHERARAVRRGDLRRGHDGRGALGAVGQRRDQHLRVRHRQEGRRVPRAARDEHLPPDQGRRCLSRGAAGARHERPARRRLAERQGRGPAAGRQFSGKPVLLRLDEQAGHGGGSTAQQAFSLRADIYSFLLWQFGKLPPAQPQAAAQPTSRP